jgi:ribosomal protein S18 acetylase RimI-like enzyme
VEKPTDVARLLSARIEKAIASLWVRQSSWMPGGRVEHVSGATLVMTDAEAPGLRGALFLTGEHPERALDEAVAIAESCGRDLAIDLFRIQREDLATVLPRRGFSVVASRQLMVLDRTPEASVGRTAVASDLDAVRSIQSKAFAMSGAEVDALFPPSVLDEPDTRIHVVENESVVATATAHHDMGTVGIFGVACDPRFTGHGHGSAATMSAAADAKERDADIVWLQAGDDVAPFYERLGFVTVDRCEVWTNAYV